MVKSPAFLHFRELLESFQKVPESFRKLLETFQKLPETFQKLPESFRELLEGFRARAFSFRADPPGYLFLLKAHTPIGRAALAATARGETSAGWHDERKARRSGKLAGKG